MTSQKDTLIQQAIDVLNQALAVGPVPTSTPAPTPHPTPAPTPPPNGLTFYVPEGTTVVYPGKYPDGSIIKGQGDRSKIILLRQPGTNGTLILPFWIENVTVDGNCENTADEAMTEIGLHQNSQTVRNVEVRNFRFLGINFTGTNGVIEDCVVEGVSPGGLTGISFMGIHSQEGSGALAIRRTQVSGTSLNGIFLDGKNQRVENCRLFDCHLGITQDEKDPKKFYGGGSIDCSEHSSYSTIIDNEIGPSKSKNCSGIECDGTMQTIERNNIYGLPNGTGIVGQNGNGSVIRYNDVSGCKTGLYIDPACKNFTYTPNDLHDNIEANLTVG